MPTGYTSEIADGISFEKFAMNCARAFGALIMMRDEPASKPIPKKFKPSTWNKDKIQKTEKELAELEKITIPTANQRAKKEYGDELAYAEEGIRKANDLRAKYLVMLGAVQAWQPPTPDHQGLKDFMIEQIDGSIDFDCSTKYHIERVDKLYALTPSEWKTKQKAKLLEDLAYHKKEHLEEVKRTADRNEWVQKLRESLGIKT